MKSIFITLLLMIQLNNFSQDIEKYKWKNRILLVYTEDTNDSSFLNQLKDFKQNITALNERKLKIYLFTKNTYQILNDNKVYSIEKDHPFNKENSLFKIKLMGLDGTIKFT